MKNLHLHNVSIHNFFYQNRRTQEGGRGGGLQPLSPTKPVPTPPLPLKLPILPPINSQLLCHLLKLRLPSVQGAQGHLAKKSLTMKIFKLDWLSPWAGFFPIGIIN